MRGWHGSSADGREVGETWDGGRGGARENRAEDIKDTVAGDFPQLVTGTKLPVQKAQCMANRAITSERKGAEAQGRVKGAKDPGAR